MQTINNPTQEVNFNLQDEIDYPCTYHCPYCGTKIKLSKEENYQLKISISKEVKGFLTERCPECNNEFAKFTKLSGYVITTQITTDLTTNLS